MNERSVTGSHVYLIFVAISSSQLNFRGDGHA